MSINSTCDQQVEELLRPLAEHRDRLQTIPGVGRRTAEVILAEIGGDMTVFPSAAHLASWAGLCPGNHESAGRRQTGRTRKGSRWLRAALVEASWSAGRVRNSYMAQFKARLGSRRGRKRAAVAVAHKILIAAWHVLRNKTPYQDLGPDHFDRLHHQRLAGYHLRRLKQLGLTVTVQHDDKAA